MFKHRAIFSLVIAYAKIGKVQLMNPDFRTALSNKELQSILSESSSIQEVVDKIRDLGFPCSASTLIRYKKKHNLDSSHFKYGKRWKTYGPEKKDLSFLKTVVADSFSYAEVLSKLGVPLGGGNYEGLKRSIIYHNLDISHFTFSTWNSGKTRDTCIGVDKTASAHEWDDSRVFCSPSLFSNFRNLKKRYMKLRRDPKCDLCNLLPEWQNKPLVLQLDHIDGNKFNNVLSNLRLLCPNCHSQTPTYAGRNVHMKNKQHIESIQKTVHDDPQHHLSFLQLPSLRESSNAPRKCANCLKPVNKNAKRCEACAHDYSRKVIRPPLDELIQLIKKHGYLPVGKMFDVSDNAVRKWLRAYGVDPKTVKKEHTSA